jgi:sigma-B regulation protein RsbU (phosphoserine phosphatase)
VALLFTVAALAVYDRSTFRSEILDDVQTLAGIIGENAASSIAFNDKQTAEATLAALKAQPHIVTGAVYDNTGALFATYGAAPPPRAPRDGAASDETFVSAARPVLFNGARVGTVYLKSDLEELTARRNRYLELAGLVLIVATTVALLLAWLMQRAISRPIRRLLAVEKRVSRDKDYSLRVEKEANDEVGELIDGFNEMLGEIRARDAEIQSKHDQEMALARSIQTSVLPRRFDFPGFDISAVMLPAEEVGGDFYEFRRYGGGAWVGIGDVTGHGVTSGLIMMMAQSMFTMLCEQNGHVSPAKFLVALNRAMFYNLKARLDQDKFMTMVVARIEENGRVTYAGAHTDLLIYRAATGKVERLETQGLWLGVTDDIASVTDDRTITLGRGDVALLHTDGVTEARNAKGECYDMERLTAALQNLHGERASDIVKLIADAAWQWAGTPTDDVSLMAIKRVSSSVPESLGVPRPADRGTEEPPRNPRNPI